MATMLALLHRDMRVARRELKFFFLRVGIQPVLFTFIFGFVMPRLGIVQTGYANMLLPGILALSMTLSGMQSVALPLVVEFGWTKEIEDRLLAPISIMGVAVEKIIVGIIQAVIAGLFVLPLAWLMMGTHLSLQPSNFFLLLSAALLTSWVVLGVWDGDRHHRRAATDRLDIQRAAWTDDLLRLHLLPVGVASSDPVVSEVRADQPAGLCERGLSRRAHPPVAAHVIVVDLRRTGWLLRVVHLSRVAKIRTPLAGLTWERRASLPACRWCNKENSR